MNNAHWTPQEDAVLIEIRALDIPPINRMALYKERLPQRTSSAIHNRVKVLNLPRRPTRNNRRWTAEEREWLRRESAHKKVSELAELLPAPRGDR